jgi:hypothetical protein
VSAHTSRSLTLSIPAVTLGEYRVQLRNAMGTSVDNSTHHLSSVLTHDAVIASGSRALSTGGTVIDLTGSGFGTDYALFTAQGLTAAVNGTWTAVTWVNDAKVRIMVPGGTPGSQPSILLYTLGVPGGASRAVRYAADINWLSPSTVRRNGGVTVVGSGRGFRNSSSWKLVSTSGARTGLKTYNSRAALNRSSSGVYRESDTVFVVKVPRAPHGRGAYRVVFTSVTGASMDTSAAAITYR